MWDGARHCPVRLLFCLHWWCQRLSMIGTLASSGVQVTEKNAPKICCQCLLLWVPCGGYYRAQEPVAWCNTIHWQGRMNGFLTSQGSPHLQCTQIVGHLKVVHLAFTICSIATTTTWAFTFSAGQRQSANTKHKHTCSCEQVPAPATKISPPL